ncbi:MAG: hypothetical protein ACTSVB_07905 [Candidatus Heimdallarchaeaceae archaeon]
MKVKIGSLKDCYEAIIELIQSYVDIDPKYLPILALWVIGTYLHDHFRTYPYLYINATKGGGKTRLLGLLSFLSKNGKMNVDMSEAVLFREAQNKTAFFIDELEHITRKEKTGLRLLLNSAYKKGITVTRAKKNKKTESYDIERFSVFTPIAMANIWGLENVLQDRCITVVLEKSYNPAITSRIELWEEDKKAKAIKEFLEEYSSGVVSVVISGVVSFTFFWNKIISYYIFADHNDTAQTTPKKFDDLMRSVDWLDPDNNALLTKEFYEMAKKIWCRNISGRDLELFMPLFIIAHEISDDVFDNILNIAGQIVKEKHIDEISENRDFSFIAFLSNFDNKTDDWIKIIKLTNEFKEFEEEDWINARWIGRVLKRLNIIKGKRRLKHGREVILNWKKIDEKAKQIGVEPFIVETKKEETQTGLDKVIKKKIKKRRK